MLCMSVCHQSVSNLACYVLGKNQQCQYSMLSVISKSVIECSVFAQNQILFVQYAMYVCLPAVNQSASKCVMSLVKINIVSTVRYVFCLSSVSHSASMLRLWSELNIVCTICYVCLLSVSQHIMPLVRNEHRLYSMPWKSVCHQSVSQSVCYASSKN